METLNVHYASRARSAPAPYLLAVEQRAKRSEGSYGYSGELIVLVLRPLATRGERRVPPRACSCGG